MHQNDTTNAPLGVNLLDAIPATLHSRLIPLAPRSKVPPKRFRWRDRAPATWIDLDSWMFDYPGCNWGIRTGDIGDGSGSLVVLDIDRPTLAPAFVSGASTWRVVTAKGSHNYLTAANPVKSRREPWGDLKATGGYVVAPYSLHPDGLTVYTPADGWGIGQLPLFDASIFDAPAPSQIGQTTTNTVVGGEWCGDQDGLGYGTTWPKAKPERPGKRNATLLTMLLTLAGRNPTIRGDAARLTGAAHWYNRHFQPPLPDGEVRAVASQVVGYSAKWCGPTADFSERQRERVGKRWAKSPAVDLSILGGPVVRPCR